MAVTESGAVITVPTPDILEQSERFAEKEAIADGDINASLAKVSAPRHCIATVATLLIHT